MVAPVTDYTSFNAQLNRQVGQDSDTEVAATIGRKLTIRRPPRAATWISL